MTNWNPESSLEEIIQQFQLAAAEVQSAYHQLEQEILSMGQDEAIPAPMPPNLVAPNLAPLHLMGTLVTGLSQSAAVLNQDLAVISTNSEAKREFALGQSSSLRQVLSPDSSSQLDTLIDTMTSKSAVDLKLRNGTSAGVYDCIYLDNPIEKGRLLLLVAHEEELDHLRQVEDQILKNLTGTLVHEIRTPLTSMQGFAELLMQVQNLEPKETDKLNIIQGGIERLSLLASALGTVFHESLKPNWVKVNINSFIEEAVHSFRSEKDLDADLIEVRNVSDKFELVTDPEILKMIIVQLLANAYESLESASAGDIICTLNAGATEVVIQIIDKGIGIGKDDVSQWWVPFYTNKNGHLGLGLVRVRRMLEALSGKATIVSSTKGGVEVSIILPV